MKKKERRMPSTLEQRITMVMAILCLVVMVVLLYYVMSNVEVLTNSPCNVCEKSIEGMRCNYIPDMIKLRNK